MEDSHIQDSHIQEVIRISSPNNINKLHQIWQGHGLLSIAISESWF